MQLKIYINLGKKTLTLPINYGHIIQGIIYTSLQKDSHYKNTLHNDGIHHSNYKLFTFSSLCGKHTIQDKMITFYDTIFLEIRSIDPYFIFLLYEYLKKNKITFKDQTFPVSLSLENKIIQSDSLLIKMNSPLTISKKDENLKSIYLSPRDNVFEEYINHNFKKKYYSYYHTEPFSDIEIIPSGVTFQHKVVTTLKEIITVGWKGEYILSGSPDYLTFLYNTGLGNKNSQGFGLFDILEEDYDE